MAVCWSMKDHIVAMTTCPPQDSARIANTLVEERLCACVNIISGISSVYRWRGEVTTDEETLLVIKTRSELLDVLKKRLSEIHPYEVPELIAVDVVAGLAGYLGWIDDCVAREE